MLDPGRRHSDFPEARRRKGDGSFEAALDHHRTGDLKKACDGYRKILKRSPRHCEALHLLGLATVESGHPERGVQLIAKAANLAPSNALYRFSLGETLLAIGRLDGAVAAFREVLGIDPGSAAALASLGNALGALKQFDEALACHRRAVKLAPQSAEIRSNLGTALKESGQATAAVVVLRDAAALAPDHREIRFNLGNALLAEGRFAEAEAAYGLVLAADPAHVRARSNLGVALREQGRAVEAAANLRVVIEARPDWAEAHWNLGLALLMGGNYEEGWREYEWRRRIPGFAIRNIEGLAWDGTPLKGRTLFIHAEQGLGDTLQFVRYVGLARQTGGTVRIECPPGLVRLLKAGGLCDAVIGRGKNPGDFDVQAPLMSLPHLIDPNLTKAGSLVPYLSAEPELVRRCRLSSEPGFKVGICWQGNPAYRADPVRSIALAEFAPLARIPGVRLISLQKGFGCEQLPMFQATRGIEELGPGLDETTGAFVDTAAVMANLDLVITSDTAVAHLAGGMGVKVWLALAQAPDWRWGREGETSPWYPTMRIFRQLRAGDWRQVFARISAALAVQISKRGL